MINDLTLKTKAGFFGFGDAPPSITDTSPLLAYSLRDVYGANVYVIRLRRADNTESDFKASELTESNIDSWTSSGTAYVVKWYQQNATYDGELDAVQNTTSIQPVLEFESENEPYIRTTFAGGFSDATKIQALMSTASTDLKEKFEEDLSLVHTSNIDNSQSQNTTVFGSTFATSGTNRNYRAMRNRYQSPVGTFLSYTDTDDSGSIGVSSTVDIGLLAYSGGGSYKTYISTSEGNPTPNDFRSFHHTGETTGNSNTANLGAFDEPSQLSWSFHVVAGFQPSTKQKFTETLVYDRVLTTADKEFIDSMASEMRY